MTYSKPNASAATGTSTRLKDISPFSGMCVTCEEGCVGLCEIGKSAYRGREVLYPRPFGKITAGSQKDYPIDFSHLTILGQTLYTIGLENGESIFPNVKIETEIGGVKASPIKLKIPAVVAAMGSTEIARRNWEGLASGAAISGTLIIVGENVCGMDMEASWDYSNNKVIKSPDMEFRIKSFRDWYDGYGEIGVQLNPHDSEHGVAEYVSSKLEVNLIELKRGQGAKSIGGEVQINDIKKAIELKRRGYLVHPDPEDEMIKEMYENGILKVFERHSKTPELNEEAFLEKVDRLREMGVKYISLKTGGYRPYEIAHTLKLSSEAKLDFITFDGAGGGTGMSPWRMMNEWGIPTFYLESLIYSLACYYKEKNRNVHLPSILIAGGITLEDHIVKALALGSPYVKAVGMARAPLTSVMVAKTLTKQVKEQKLSQQILKEYVSSTSENSEKVLNQLFIKSTELKEKYGSNYKRLLESGAIGLYTYLDRLAIGIKQFLAGLRKFDIKMISRDDVACLTREAESLVNYYPAKHRPKSFVPIKFVPEVDEEKIREVLR